MECKFNFPDDIGKTPLVEFEVNCTEKDIIEGGKVVSGTGSGVGTIIGVVLGAAFLAHITFMAVMSKAYTAAVIYGVCTVLTVLVPLMHKLTAKKAGCLAPNDSPFHRYRFFLHHFTVESCYEGSSLSYDDLGYAVENSLMFVLYANNGLSYFIPKHCVESKSVTMLHNVLVNKLGSKFTQKII
ncbi:MAG: YcxB family protein [Oscillospiraceae bacterium]|nr:YcxB family protein [Oscillospiraceae bacterium]